MRSIITIPAPVVSLLLSLNAIWGSCLPRCGVIIGLDSNTHHSRLEDGSWAAFSTDYDGGRVCLIESQPVPPAGLWPVGSGRGLFVSSRCCSGNCNITRAQPGLVGRLICQKEIPISSDIACVPSLSMEVRYVLQLTVAVIFRLLWMVGAATGTVN